MHRRPQRPVHVARSAPVLDISKNLGISKTSTALDNHENLRAHRVTSPASTVTTLASNFSFGSCKLTCAAAVATAGAETASAEDTVRGRRQPHHTGR
jgi:hypothetical protein